ncbi:MAG: dTMP kinase [Acidimicrobiales bacterium]
MPKQAELEGRTPRGRFLAFEGGEGRGKSTQAARLADTLGALLTREPGGTLVGERIRELVLDPPGNHLSVRAEALLMAAARAQHVARVIEPALARGRDVVTDRFLASSVAYQGHGRGLDPDEVMRLSLWATEGLQPDLVVLLDLPERIASERSGAAGDRLEAAGPDFHGAVADGFRALAAADPTRWIVVDGTAAIDAVAERVMAEIRNHPLFRGSLVR